MLAWIDRLSLKARLLVLAFASVGLMLTYVGVNTLMRSIAAEHEVQSLGHLESPSGTINNKQLNAVKLYYLYMCMHGLYSK